MMLSSNGPANMPGNSVRISIRIGLMARGRPRQQRDCVWQHADDGAEALSNTFWTAGQVNDKRPAPHSGNCTARDAIGVCRSPSARIASGSPGARRSSTESVASGVTSRGPSPVPPVVRMRSSFSSSHHLHRSATSITLVRNHLIRGQIGAERLNQLSYDRRTGVFRSPRAPASLVVNMPTRIGSRAPPISADPSRRTRHLRARGTGYKIWVISQTTCNILC